MQAGCYLSIGAALRQQTQHLCFAPRQLLCDAGGWVALCLGHLAQQFACHSRVNKRGYPIVDTGQHTCYDENTAIDCPAGSGPFSGQDAQFVGNVPSYTNNQNGTITDNVTGMMWQQSPDTNGDGVITVADKFTSDGAVSYCENLSLAGYTDWRLPDIKQLYSLMDFPCAPRA